MENAIEISFRTLQENPGKRIFLLSEMIHNPHVNADLQQRGLQFLQDTHGNQLIPFSTLNADDIVIIPAFGTTLDIEKKLNDIGIQTARYNTTCPFVERVWNRSEQIAQKNYTVIVHGKPGHEETRATFSHASSHTPTLVLNNMNEAIELAKYINGEKPAEQFAEAFKGQFSNGFDARKDLERIGVVNQTTMLASDTQAISDFLKQTMILKYNLTGVTVGERFADTRDTLCYATNDNQTAVSGMLNAPADLAIVVGGYNSSNTSHLVELCEEKLPTFFISSEQNILSPKEILHYNFHTKQELITANYLPDIKPVKVLLTSGASCPDSMVESIVQKLAEFYNEAGKMNGMIASFS